VGRSRVQTVPRASPGAPNRGPARGHHQSGQRPGRPICFSWCHRPPPVRCDRWRVARSRRHGAAASAEDVVRAGGHQRDGGSAPNYGPTTDHDISTEQTSTVNSGLWREVVHARAGQADLGVNRSRVQISPARPNDPLHPSSDRRDLGTSAEGRGSASPRDRRHQHGGLTSH
jgi:hypothetical protein